MHAILNVYKPQGCTPLEVIDALKKDQPTYENVTISYAGRLDPMADGVLLLLCGDANNERTLFERLPKTYRFTMILGVATDSYDTMGIISAVTPSSISQIELDQVLTHWPKTFEQPYPPYSSARVNGKPLFYWAREGKLDSIAIPTKHVTIHSLQCLSIHHMPFAQIATESIAQIHHVNGDFRQKDIVDLWDSFNKIHQDESLTLAECEVSCESGLYVRSLAHEIGKQLGCGACTFSITRTRVGDYVLTDSIHLKNI